MTNNRRTLLILDVIDVIQFYAESRKVKLLPLQEVELAEQIVDRLNAKEEFKTK